LSTSTRTPLRIYQVSPNGLSSTLKDQSQVLSIACEHRDRIPTMREAARDRRSGSRTYPGHDYDGFSIRHEDSFSSISSEA
jgi:hypothetical protein